jgi:RNA polymerase sigma-70 factor (ECF subfamily)
MRGNDDAKDIAQETFLKAWQQFDPQLKHSFRAWVMRIARNQVIDRCRRKGLKVWYAGDNIEKVSPVDCESDQQLVSESEFYPEGLPAFSRLPVQQREIVFMRYVEQISYEEISRITGKSQDALRKIVSRAVLTIRKEVTKDAMQQSE